MATLVERYADRVLGVLSCYDRAIVRGYIRGFEFAKAMDRCPLTLRPYQLETSIPGVLVVGDARAGNVKRVAAAVARGRSAFSSSTASSRSCEAAVDCVNFNPAMNYQTFAAGPFLADAANAMIQSGVAFGAMDGEVMIDSPGR